MAKIEKYRAALVLINEILNDIFNVGGMDAIGIQDRALELGLLREEQMAEPCQRWCNCEQNGAGFPTMCCRKTYKHLIPAPEAKP